MNSRPPTATSAVETTGAPTQCPSCRSKQVTTASKVVNAATYWRCGECGDVWNVQRRRDGSRYNYPPQWGR